MRSAALVAIFGSVHFGALAAVFLIIPRLWRPEVPFGVSVPSEGSEAARRRALRYWTTRVILLTAGAFAGTLLLARFKPEMWAVKLFVIPYFALGVFFYDRARRMLAPLAVPSEKVSAALRPRRYGDYLSPWWEVIPAGLIVLGLGLLAWLLLTSSKGVGAFAIATFPGLFVYPLLLLTTVLMAHSKQAVGTGDPDVCLAANEALRKVWIRYMYALRVYLAALLVTIPACIALMERGLIPAGPAVPIVLVALVAGGVAAFFAWGWIIGLRYGQGGWRWAVREGLVERSQVAAILDGDGMQDDRWKLGMLYFNPADPSILVEHRFGVGWTANLGNIWGITLVLAFIGTYALPPLLRLLVK